MSPLVAGLAPRGTLVVVGAAGDPIQVGTSDLIFGGRSILGSRTGAPIDNEDNVTFSAAHGVAPMVEVVAFEETPTAYERMLSGQARLGVVLEVAEGRQTEPDIADVDRYHQLAGMCWLLASYRYARRFLGTWGFPG